MQQRVDRRVLLCTAMYCYVLLCTSVCLLFVSLSKVAPCCSTEWWSRRLQNPILYCFDWICCHFWVAAAHSQVSSNARCHAPCFVLHIPTVTGCGLLSRDLILPVCYHPSHRSQVIAAWAQNSEGVQAADGASYQKVSAQGGGTF